MGALENSHATPQFDNYTSLGTNEQEGSKSAEHSFKTNLTPSCSSHLATTSGQVDTKIDLINLQSISHTPIPPNTIHSKSHTIDLQSLSSTNLSHTLYNIN